MSRMLKLALFLLLAGASALSAKTIEDFEASLAFRPGDAALRLDYAAALGAAGRYAEANAQVMEAVGRLGGDDPLRVRATNLLASAALKKGRADKAKALYGRAADFADRHGLKTAAAAEAYQGLLALLKADDPRRASAQRSLEAIEGPPAAAEAPAAAAPLPQHPTEAESAAAQVQESTEPYEEPLAERMRSKLSIAPFVYFDLIGGQYFFGGQQGALAANAHLTASGAVKDPGLPNWTFIPMITSQYQGTKQVTDLAGGGTLFQESMEHSASLKAVYEASPRLRVKPELGYKWSYLKETRDETWGRGLFDYRRPEASIEAEYLYNDPFSLRLSYDYYYLNFPNYVSLESVAAGTQGLARELTGKNVINSANHALSLAGSVEAPGRSLVEGQLSSTLRVFPEQRVVVANGSLRSRLRQDLVTAAGVSWKLPRQIAPAAKLVTGLSLGYIYTASNQNDYDAVQANFLANYYDSKQTLAGASAVLSLDRGGDRPLVVSAAANYGYAYYHGRPAQNAAGGYGTVPVHTGELYLSAGLSWPIAPHFSWTANLQYDKQSSNMRFEKLYVYNYDAFTYLMGFTWEY